MKRPVSKHKGFALAMTLIIVALVAIVTFTAVNISTLDQKASTQELIATQAAYAARAGVSQALAIIGPPIMDGTWKGTGSGAVTKGEAQLGSDLEYAVRVEYAGGIVWKVTSTGFYRGARRTLVAYLEREPFAKYAYFTDRDVSAAGTNIWFTTNSLVTGPAHTNGHFRISGTPEWTSSVTSANLQDSRYTKNPPAYKQEGTQTDPAKFYQTYTSYKVDAPKAGPDPHDPKKTSADFYFAGGRDEIPLPEDLVDLAQAAAQGGWAYSDGSYKYDEGEYDYDIQVEEGNKSGEVTSVRRADNGSSNFKAVSETSAPPVYKLEFKGDGTAVLTKKKVGSSSTWQTVDTINTTTQPGVTLHVDGFLLLKGTVKGRVTVSATQDIHNIDNLVYKDMNTDVLGVVGQKNFVVQSNKNIKDNRSIHGTIMTLEGSFYVDEYGAGKHRGDLKVFGGLIQKYRGAVGTFTVDSSGKPSPNSGYEKDYEYDEKLQVRPPLNFPMTSNVEVTQLIDQGAPGGV